MEYSDYIVLAMNMMRHAYRYYELDADPEIPDHVYDKAYHRLLEYEEGNPNHTTPLSPTQYVGFNKNLLVYREGEERAINV